MRKVYKNKLGFYVDENEKNQATDVIFDIEKYHEICELYDKYNKLIERFDFSERKNRECEKEKHFINGKLSLCEKNNLEKVEYIEEIEKLNGYFRKITSQKACIDKELSPRKKHTGYTLWESKVSKYKFSDRGSKKFVYDDTFEHKFETCYPLIDSYNNRYILLTSVKRDIFAFVKQKILTFEESSIENYDKEDFEIWQNLSFSEYSNRTKLILFDFQLIFNGRTNYCDIIFRSSEDICNINGLMMRTKKKHNSK